MTAQTLVAYFSKKIIFNLLGRKVPALKKISKTLTLVKKMCALSVILKSYVNSNQDSYSERTLKSMPFTINNNKINN